MTHTSHPIRPARAAIAAVLALTATPLLAQEASPAPTAGPTVAPTMPQPQPSAPSAVQPGVPPQASIPAAPSAAGPAIAQPPAASLPGTPMASPVAPPTVTDVPVAAIAPAADVATAPARRAATPPRPAARPAPQTVQAERVAVPETTATATAPLDTPIIEQEAAAVPVAIGEPVASTPVTEETAATGGNQANGDVWGWMAGLLALLGIGGGAIALRRTRTRKSAAMMAEARTADADYDRRLAGPHDRPQAATVTTPVPALATERFDQPVMQPPAAASMAAARPTSTRTPVAPRGELTVDERRLENLIAQRPNRDNPFKTRANRKRRALFLMRNGYGMQTAA